MAEGALSGEEAEAALIPPEYDPKNVPKSVKGVARLRQDFEALEQGFEPEAPPLISLRALAVYHIMYGFGRRYCGRRDALVCTHCKLGTIYTPSFKRMDIILGRSFAS
jgi:hypothetical protein